jgi:hypothetical protein
MARQIKLDQIDDYAREQVVKLVRVATLEADRRLKAETPVDTGRLRQSWQTVVQDFDGRVFNNVEYAAPVIAGTNLPPSWQGKQRTTPFLDIVAKDIQTWVTSEAAKIGRES